MRFGLDGIPLEQTRTGVGHYTFELAHALARIAPEDEFQVICPSASSLATHSEQQPAPNLSFARLKVSKLSRRAWWVVRLPRHIRKASLSLFHGTNFDVPLWASCPTVLTIHDLSLLVHPETHEPRLVRRARRNLPLMTRAAAAIITDSASVKREVIQLLHVTPEKVFPIPLAARSVFYPRSLLEADVVRQKLGIEEQFILFVGTIEPRKNLDTLIRAYDELVHNTSYQTQLVIAGNEGWLSDEFLSGLRKFGTRVVVTGYLSDEELGALYSSCQVFIYPSLYEGFGLPPLEAMACGAPVITSDAESLRETFGEVARVVSAKDFRQLAASIAQLMDHPEERTKRSQAGLEHAAKFSWERTAAATLDVYRKVLDVPR